MERIPDPEIEGEFLIVCECGNHNSEGQPRCGYCGERLEAHAEHKVYIPKNFSAAHEQIISQANDFLDDFEQQGFSVSLRQLYYQFVASVPGFPNTEQSYKRLGGIITNARLAGRISFDSIEDRGRSCYAVGSQPDPNKVLDNLAYRYSEDYWAGQDSYVEVWVEKDALSGVIERPCNRLRVPHMACKGYMSASAAYEAGQRFKDAHDAGKTCVLIHLGDHDPSGIDMTRDNGKRLQMFAESPVKISRIGLNMDQIEKYSPPPNPTKVTDSRAEDYITRFGYTCWELDALSPKVIDRLITDEVNKYIDPDEWSDTTRRERINRALIDKIEANKEAVFEFVRSL